MRRDKHIDEIQLQDPDVVQDSAIMARIVWLLGSRPVEALGCEGDAAASAPEMRVLRRDTLMIAPGVPRDGTGKRR
jgi:hypothetical protein